MTKPGIVYGNAIAAIAGFFLASKGEVDFVLFAAMLIGISFVIASACVFNNYLDRDIDKKMERTNWRALAKGSVSTTGALAFGSVVGAVGFALLFFFTNPLTAAIGAFGFIVYVGIYTPAKRRTIHSTAIGSFAGAVPPVAGYVAVSGRLDMGALLIFLVLVFWQMSHFYAIAIFRLKEYKAARVPILSAKEGVHATKSQIVMNMVGFVVACLTLTLYGVTGYTYLLVMLLVGLWWLKIAVRDYESGKNEEAWARRVFKGSFITLLTFCLMISIDTWLP